MHRVRPVTVDAEPVEGGNEMRGKIAIASAAEGGNADKVDVEFGRLLAGVREKVRRLRRSFS